MPKLFDPEQNSVAERSTSPRSFEKAPAAATRRPSQAWSQGGVLLGQVSQVPEMQHGGADPKDAAASMERCADLPEAGLRDAPRSARTTRE